MFALGLLTCAVLTAFSAHAEVVDDFKGCKNFFYKNTEPRGMDQNAKKICQVYGQGQSTRYYYATLYSTEHRIPLYSAYVFDPECESDSGRTDSWHVEPQISGYRDYRNMVLERDLKKLGLKKDVIKSSQAMSSDYNLTGYDRGQLNPSSFNCGDGRNATFTLTNAAPMDPCFNRVHWRNWELALRSVLLDHLRSDGGSATAYIVTGTVPNTTLRIPQPGRVTVPSHIWTAVCYKHTDNSKSFSIGFMGKNKPEEYGIDPFSVSDLNDQLSKLYSQLSETPQTVNIFTEGCSGDNNKLDMVKEIFTGKIHMSTAVENTLAAVKRATGSDSQSSEKVRVKEMSATLACDSMDTLFTTAEDLKDSDGRACLITGLRSVVRKYVHDELSKREVSEGSDAGECLLAPEKQKTAADGSPCSSVSETSSSCECHIGDKVKPCCSSPCLYRPKRKSYWCYSGQTLIACSPPYSFVTVKGERCLDDHPCGKYGEDYYWCKTYRGYFKDDWDYCSPPLRNSKAKNRKACRNDRACGNYGSTKMWRYTDDEDNNERYFTSDDCRSAVNGKTCRSDHMCGYHGYGYLWCYTDYRNHWDYCCTNCAQMVYNV